MRVKRISPANPAVDEQEAIQFEELDHLIDKYKTKKGNVIPLLQGAQNIFGYLPMQAFERIALKTGLKLSDMYGVATFYAQFRLKPVGKNIVKVCHGTACHVQNADSITDALKEALGVNDGETTPDGLFTLESVACLGCCSLAPVMMIGDDTYGKLTGKSAMNIIKEIKLREKQ